jgi:DNA polymerase
VDADASLRAEPALAALRLQIEWGADEALLEAPVDRLARHSPAATRAAGRADPPPIADPNDTPGTTRAARPGAAPRRAAAAVATLGEAAETARRMAADAADLPALVAALRAFDPHGLSATATSLVAPRGDTAPGIGLALIGDTPGADEDRSGIPFSGAAGELLDQMLASVGLGRAQLTLAHLLPWRPPGGRPPSEAELAAYLPFLHRLLTLLGARRLVLCGTGPLRALCGSELVLSRVRGRWRETSVPGLQEPVPALPCFAPAQLLQRPELKASAWADLRLLRRTLDEK